MMKKTLVASAACLTLLSAFPLMAKSTDDRRSENGFSLGVHANVAMDTACMQSAVRTRDNALVDAFSAYNQSLATALHTRTDAQVSAWAKVNLDERAIALKASEKAFTSSYNDASRQLDKTKKTIRTTYSNAEKNCKKNGRSSSSSTTSSSSSSVSSASSVACKDVNGKLTGAFTLAAGLPDVGRTYNLTGTGSVSAIGSVSANGSVHTLGFIAMGRATGDITLTQGSSTAVLHLEGPVQTGFSGLPTSFHYTVQSANGVFASWKDASGNLELHIKGETNGSLKIEFNGRCER